MWEVDYKKTEFPQDINRFYPLQVHPLAPTWISCWTALSLFHQLRLCIKDNHGHHGCWIQSCKYETLHGRVKASKVISILLFFNYYYKESAAEVERWHLSLLWMGWIRAASYRRLKPNFRSDAVRHHMTEASAWKTPRHKLSLHHTCQTPVFLLGVSVLRIFR